ncbi:MAG: murein biosynthesis integral membrane protein MurJ [Bdellovibrionaceae bacterium]|nr:murein biosynthesis integral membrane protein MurJ [Pseudobdellovibrionaceae bacterium]
MESTDQINIAAKNDKNQVVKKALSMALGTFSSRLLALFREILLTSYFNRTITDAWTVAFRLPNIFRRLLGEGSLSVSFIPIFVDCLMVQKDEVRARNLVNSLYTMLLLILTCLTVAGIVFSEPILKIFLDPSYIAQTDKFQITNTMAQIMFGFIFLMSSYAYFMGILNAFGKFGLAAMAPTLFNVAMIISTLIPDGVFSFHGEGLAWGVMVGGVLQAGLLVPSLIKKGYFPKVSFDFKNPDMLLVFKNMIPGLFGMGLLQISLIINQRFASSLGEGVMTSIYLADRLLELPLSLISVSLGTALLPTLSKFWAENNKKMMISTTEFYMRLNLYVVLPAATGLYVLSEPIVEVLFKRGHFSLHDVQVTSEVLKIWALIMIPSSCVKILAPAYYAIKNTWFPAVVSLLCLVSHYLVAPLLMAHWGLRGLNVSSLFSNSLNFILLIGFFPYFMASLPVRNIVISLLKMIAICGLVAGVSQIYYITLELHLIPLKFFNQVLSLGVTILVAGITLVLASFLFKMEEYNATLGKVFSKVAGRFSF